MIKKHPSFDSTWARPPATHTSRSSSSTSSNRLTRLPYRPTPNSHPTASTLYRSTPSPPLRTAAHKKSSRSYLSNYPPPSIPTFQWMRGELVGQGSYGRVFMALNVSTGELMAVKQVEFPLGDGKPEQHEALRFLAFESETLRELDHPNIVQYLGCENSTEALSVFLEYVPGGTIATLLRKYGRFREEITKSFTQQILEGLDYLHANGIIHRDLKPDNILVEPTGVCKISDFGISKRVEDMYSARAHTLMKGTVQYMAPEILGSKEKGYDGRIDIWSIGCMVMEMWTGEKPWGSAEVFWSILLKLGSAQSPPPLPAQLQRGLSSDAHNFRESCFHINPVQRPSAADLKLHPYLRLPPTWMFDETEIPHPSRERRLPLDNQKKLEQHDDGATYKPRRHLAGSQDTTIRQHDIYNTAVLETIRPPIPRAPSPPIVIIHPIKRGKSSPQPPSLVEAKEQDNSTSGSSHTSSSRRSGKTKLKYHVANPQEQSIVPYEYCPPPLPPTSRPYSSHLGTSSEYSLDYVPESFSNSSSHPSLPSSSHITSTRNQTIFRSSSATNLTHSHSSSKSPGSSLPQSTGIKDTTTWKRPPVTNSPQREGKLIPPSPSHERRHGGRGAKSHGNAQRSRTPPAPIVPPPLPPTTPPTYYRRGNRPETREIIRDLGIYFPDHDLDQPVVTATSSVNELAEDSASAPNGGSHREDIDANDPSSSRHTPSQRVTLGDPRGLAHLRPRPTSSSPSSHDHKHSMRPSPSNVAPLPNTPIPRGDAKPQLPAENDYRENSYKGASIKGAGIRHTKSIRRIAEEREIKRRSHPGKIRRRTFWDSKMEELPGFPSPTWAHEDFQ